MIIRWGMVGCGDVTEVKSGPALYKARNSALLAVTSRTREKAEDYALRHGVPKVYSDLSEMLADPEIDAIIASQNFSYRASSSSVKAPSSHNSAA